MGIPDLDIGLTGEQKSMRDMVRKFGAQVVRPAGIELDKFHEPADVTEELDGHSGPGRSGKSQWNEPGTGERRHGHCFCGSGKSRI